MLLVPGISASQEENQPVSPRANIPEQGREAGRVLSRPQLSPLEQK